MGIKEFLLTAIDLVLPSFCPICKKGKLRFPSPICAMCQEILARETAPAVISTPHIIEIVSCSPYEGTVKKCIKEFKYHKRPDMMRLFDGIMLDAVKSFPFIKNGCDIIVPVPLHRIKHRERGFNQAGIIAESLSKMLSVPINPNNLVRTKNTRAQTTLSKSVRKNNLKFSFAVRSQHLFNGKSVILVDDVITTGATLDACAKKLLRAGAKKIRGFALARTL